MRHWLLAFCFILVLAIALFAFIRPGIRDSSPADDEARRVVEACAGGFTETGKAGLSAGLAGQLRRLQAASKVSSAQVGAVIDKIRPDEIGRDVYEIYVRCLKQQTELSLLEHGVRIEAAPARQGLPENLPSPAAANPQIGVNSNRQDPPAPATERRPLQTPRKTDEAVTTYKTEGNCSQIIVNSEITSLNQQCTEPPP